MSSTQKPVISNREIMSRIEKGEIKPAYFFYGSESYLVDSIVSQIGSRFLGDVQKEINYFLRYAPDTSIDEILSLCAGSGLFSSRKLVVYKDFQNLRNPNVKKMAKYLERPNPDICLVIIARTDQIRFTKYEQLQGTMIVVSVEPLQEKDLATLVRKEFKEHNKGITDDGIESLLFLVGNQIHDLKTEIAQVCNFYQEKDKIDAKDVEEIVGVFVNQNIFDYINAIAQKDLSRAIFILHNLLERGESPFSFIALLLRHISVLWKIYGMYKSGMRNDFEIGKKLGIYSKHLAEYKSQLTGWNEQQMKIAMRLIEECDRSLKSTQMRPDLILDILSYKMVNSKSNKK